MEDIEVLNQIWKWLLLESLWCFVEAKKAAHASRVLIKQHWPNVCYLFAISSKIFCFLMISWKDCFVRGCQSFFDLGTAAMLVIIWCLFLGLTSMSCLVYLLLTMGSVACAVRYLGYTHGLLIVGLFTILIIRMYVNFWVVGPLLIVGGFLFSLNHIRLVVLLAMVYGLYYVKHQNGWFGVLVSISLAFLSNDAIIFVLERSDDSSEKTQFEERKVAYSFVEDEIPEESKFCVPIEEDEHVCAHKSWSKPTVMSTIMNKQKKASKISIRTIHVAKNNGNAIKEMKRIMGCVDHYEILGFSRFKKTDATLLKKEYKKKAMLVHPDKNMGSPLASESFKKVQSAYEVLSDSLKKWDYDEHLKNESLPRKSAATDYCSEESRHIRCTKCGHLHIWICTNRTKLKARWCQDCCQYHQARDGDGWVEYKGSLGSDLPQKVEIPQAFVCAQNKIFDVSEWAICQGMTCRPNTHRPSFHVNIVGVEKPQKSKYPWDLDSQMINEEEEFDLWLQQAVATGLFRETPKRRKSWSQFKWSRKKVKKQWTRLARWSY